MASLAPSKIRVVDYVQSQGKPFLFLFTSWPQTNVRHEAI